jgi:hypothetical protein
MPRKKVSPLLGFSHPPLGGWEKDALKKKSFLFFFRMGTKMIKQLKQFNFVLVKDSLKKLCFFKFLI